MSTKPENHLFTKYDLLAEYKITYKIPVENINKLKTKLEKKYKTKKTINKKIQEYIESEMSQIGNLKIPGLIYENSETNESDSKKLETKNKIKNINKNENLFVKDFNGFSPEDQTAIMELTKFIVNKIKTKNLSTLALFFIFQLVYNDLKIQKSTFDKIIERYKNHNKSLNDSNDD